MDIPALTTEQMIEVDRLMISDYGIELLQMMRQRIRAAEETTIEVLTAFLPLCSSCTEKLGEVGFWVTPGERALGALPAEIRKSLCEECEKKLRPSLSEDAQ